MARLTTFNDSDDELPDLSAVLRGLNTKHCSPGISSDAGQVSRQRLFIRERAERRQKSLGSTPINALTFPFTKQCSSYNQKRDQHKGTTLSSPRRKLASPQRGLSNYSTSIASSDVESELSDHLSDFIVSDSDSEDSEDSEDSDQGFAKGSPLLLLRNSPEKEVDRVSQDAIPRKKLKDSRSHQVSDRKKFNGTVLSAENSDEERKGCPTAHIASQKAEDEQEDSLDEPLSILRFSPPHFQSPSKIPLVDYQITPPSSPTKSKLLSPSRKSRIPPSPHRPSIDAFWSQEVINEWNDQYSPQETPRSRRPGNLLALDEDDEGYLSPCETRQRSPSKSPAKKDKQAAENRKVFNEKKFDLAASFLEELDHAITGGKIAELAALTGGVKLIWSKKLQSTAGRANWKREAIRSKDANGNPSTTKSRHHATIELAEKVIDDEDRLINVIAHEYCHLLNFMISNVKDNPHGREFKAWAQKCSAAFAHRGVHVTTKHSYQIVYKYIWSCHHCDAEYKRHSKSIDPAKHSCGKCKGKLVQVKPVPRGQGKGGMSEYQRFVKERFSRIKKESPGTSMSEIMTVLGREFRASKQRGQGDAVPTDGVEESGRDGLRDDVDLDSLISGLDGVDIGSRQGTGC
ncbi:MAG: hypothetical protein Q9222_002357 [Ikaeria aurantiellina]